MAAGQRWAGLGALGGNGIASVRAAVFMQGSCVSALAAAGRPVDGTSGFCKHRCAVAAPLLGKHPFQKGTSYVCIWIWFKMFSLFFFFCMLRICRITTKKTNNNNQKMHWSIQHRKKGQNTHPHSENYNEVQRNTSRFFRSMLDAYIRPLRPRSTEGGAVHTARP